MSACLCVWCLALPTKNRGQIHGCEHICTVGNEQLRTAGKKPSRRDKSEEKVCKGRDAQPQTDKQYPRGADRATHNAVTNRGTRRAGKSSCVATQWKAMSHIMVRFAGDGVYKKTGRRIWISTAWAFFCLLAFCLRGFRRVPLEVDFQQMSLTGPSRRGQKLIHLSLSAR